MKKIVAVLTVLILVSTPAFAAVTKDQVLKAQKKWAEGIENISKTFVEKGDYKQTATDHINTLYAYDMGEVLFKPTLASEDQFRETFDQALSYFVTGNIQEDSGFAIKPWKKVRFGEQEIITGDEYAAAMGNYYFTPMDSDEETKVEFTFVYIINENEELKINVHHSSLPFTPAE